jgi:hypothetical protein
MKYIWTLVLLVLMGWSWSIATADHISGFEKNLDMEAQLSQLIRDNIKSKKPDVTGINFLQLYTEMIKPGRVLRAHYRYQIDEPTKSGDSTQQVISGVSTLTSQDDGQTWTVGSTNLESPYINFVNGSHVSAKDTGVSEDKAINSEKTSDGEKANAPAEEGK